MDDIIPVLDGKVSKRTLHFFWIIDCSDSMKGRRMKYLNRAINDAIASLKQISAIHPEVNILVRIIRFDNTADWEVGPEPVSVENLKQVEIRADGTTSTASAIKMLLDELSVEKLGRRNLPPVCILLSDGYCTESDEKYNYVINELDKSPWGKKAVRLVIAVGDDNEYNEAELLKFTNHKNIGVLKASNEIALEEYLKWASVTATTSSTTAKSYQGNKEQGVQVEQNVHIPPPPDLVNADGKSFMF